jgi:type II secretion system protein N
VWWVLAAILLFAVVFWAGFIEHFPGLALSRYLEAQVNRDPRVSVRIAPAALGWTRLSIPEIRVDGAWAGGFLLALNDTEIPLSWALLEGLSLRASVGDSGVVELYWPWELGEARFSGRDLRLERIPAFAQLPVQRIQGRAEFSGTAAPRPGGQAEGRVRGRIQGLQIGNAEIYGQTFPSTRLDDVRFQVAFGPPLRLENLDLQGDIQGSLTGTITPLWARPEFTAMELQLDLGFRPEWIRQLGPFAPIAESFLDQGRLAGTLRGTPARPVFRGTRSRS